MGWLSKVLGRNGAAAPEPGLPHLPLHVELLKGAVSVSVHLQQSQSFAGRIPCWTYKTEGLRTHGQQEMILSVRLNNDEIPDRFPHDPFRFFSDVSLLAQQGRLVDEGDYSEFAEGGLFGFGGALYIEPSDWQVVDTPVRCLALVMLTDEELAACKAFGATRVMARLGQAYAYYPCPTWAERSRATLPFAASLRESQLSRAPRMRVGNLTARTDRKRIELRIVQGTGRELSEKLSTLPADGGIALLTPLDKGSHGCLVWKPGENAIRAITPQNSDGRLLSGCFVLFILGQDQDRAGIVEDGFAMWLTAASWSNLKGALAAEQALSIAADGGGMGLEVQWISTSYHNVIDGNTYYAKGGWELFSPDNKREAAGCVKQLMLLNPEHELRVRVQKEALGAYAGALMNAIEGYFAWCELRTSHDLIVQCTLSPGNTAEVKFASRPSIAEGNLRPLHELLTSLPRPEVRGGTVAFQLICSLADATNSK